VVTVVVDADSVVGAAEVVGSAVVVVSPDVANTYKNSSTDETSERETFYDDRIRNSKYQKTIPIMFSAPVLR